MRSCPKCGARYTDDLRFCLHDGTTLVAAATDDLSGQPTEQYSAQTFQADAAPNYQTLPSGDAEAETKIAPPKTSSQYSFSAVDPASNMGCTMTFGKVAAALLFVAGLGLAGIIFTSYQYTSLTAKVEPTSEPPPANSNANTAANIDLGTGNHSTSNVTYANTSSTSNSANVAATPAAKHTPQPTVAATATPAATPIIRTMPTPQTDATPVTDISGSNSVFVFRGGRLNTRAISLPQPAYPPAARAANITGRVDVRVLVDNSGRVIQANAINGHPLLRQAAAAAAMRARFPALPQPGARMRGVLTYDFP